MLTFTNAVDIERPLAEVFSFVSDQRNNPKWNYFVVSVVLTHGQGGAGTEYLQKRKTDQQRFRVVEWAANRYCVIQTLPGERPAIRRALTFSGDEMRTTIEDRVDLLVPLPRLLSGWITAGPRKTVAHNLSRLKELLETGEVILMDGRHILLDDRSDAGASDSR